MRRTLLPALSVAALVAALCSAGARPAGTGSPEPNGTIAFASERGGSSVGIFTMHADGTNVVRLTGPPPERMQPAFSPDGKSVAFTELAKAYRDELWIANADGTKPRAVVSGVRSQGVDGVTPAWSPDAHWIAYRDGRSIELVRPDGTGRRVLVTNSVFGGDPAWAPNGNEIAFDRGTSSASAVWIVGADGRGARRLHGGADPSWSPDGRRIAYLYRSHLHVMDADGTHDRALTRGPVTDSAPAWAPSGRLIAFGACCYGLDSENVPISSGIGVVRPDGTGQRVLHHGDEIDNPTWSRDGRRILFDNGFELQVMNADGSHVGPFFAGGAGEDTIPKWSPDAKRILFQGEKGFEVMNADGSGRIPIVGDEAAEASWSPDGRRIVSETTDEQIVVYTLATRRSHTILVDGDPGSVGDAVKSDPAWSRTGPVAYLDDTSAYLYVFGKHPPEQSLGFQADDGFAWSPDGRLLAYDWNGGVWVYDRSTRQHRLLIRDASEPAYSPDGRWIAFVRTIGAHNQEIFVASSDGTQARRITNSPGSDDAPSWRR